MTNVLTLTHGLNNEQKMAVEKPIDTFVKIVAGAGTGKTQIISKRYIKLVSDLLNGKITNPIERLLVITFTDKAASEMKERIIKELHNNHINYYGQENWISTIHSFCSKLLKTHAIEVNLSPSFKLADEQEQSQIYQNIVQKIKNSEVQTIDYIQDVLSELQIDLSLFESENLLKLTSINDLDTIFENIFSLIKQIKSLGLTPNEFLTQAQSATIKYSEQVKNLKFDYTTKEDYIYFWDKQLKQYQDETCIFDEDVFSNLIKTLINKQGSRKPEKWIASDNMGNIYDITETELYLTKIVACIYAIYQKHLENLDLMDFDDLINKTLHLLENNEIIRNYYKKHFKHIIVDEFQDTSTAQMKLLLNLLSDENPDITIVGDRKQSIYSFRYAKMENLDIIQKVIEEKFNQKYEPIKLINNYRSNSQVLDVVNHITEKQLNLDETLYTGLEENIIQNQKTVKLSQINNCNFVGEYGEQEAKYIAKEVVEAKKIYNLNYKDFAVLVSSHNQCNLLEEQLSNYGIPCIKKVNLNYFDKSVIKNSIAMFKFAQNIRDEHAFVRLLKINFSEKEIYQFKNQIDLQFKDTKLNFAEKIADLQEKNEILNICDNKNIANYAQKLLNTSRHVSSNKNTLSLMSIFYYLKDNINLLGDLVNIKKQMAEVDLLIFEKIISNYAQSQKYVSIKNFVDYIKQISEDKNFELPQINTDNIDAVNLMTIHASKGLEFPYVFVLNLKESSLKGSNIAFELNYGEDKNFGVLINNFNGNKSPKYQIYSEIYKRPKIQNEDLRLFYVALSRAKNYLNVMSNPNKTAWFVKDLSDNFENFKTEVGKDSFDVEKQNTQRITIKKVEEQKPVAPKQDRESLCDNSISFSKINTFNHCNQKYLLKYIYQYPEIIDKQKGIFTGSIVHNLIYNSYLNKKLFEDNQIIEFLQNMQLDELELNKILKIYSVFKTSKYAKSDMKNVFAEYDFSFSYFDNLFSGDIDLLYQNSDGTYDIVDFKTNKNIEMSLPDYSKQMYIYKLAMEAKNININNLIIVNLKEDEIKEFVLTAKMIEDAKQSLDLDIQNIKIFYTERNNIQKNINNCMNCGYKYICEKYVTITHKKVKQ